MTRIILYVMCVPVLAGCTSTVERFSQSPRIPNAAELRLDCATAAVVGLRWDAPAGGVARYEISRDGDSLAATSQPSFADNTVSESTHYSYSVYAIYPHSATPTFLGKAELNTPAPSATGDAPYCPSRYIESMSWEWANGHTEPSGSDLWPVTWGKDGRVYTSFGDGGGFGGTNERGRTSFGVAVMREPPLLSNEPVRNVYGGYNSLYPSTLEGKGGAILAVGSDFYTVGGVYTEAEAASSGQTRPVSASPKRRQLAYSKGNAHSWRATSWSFCSAEGGKLRGTFCPMGFVNFGPGNAGAPDRHVYLMGTTNSPAYWSAESAQEAASTYLARAPAQQVLRQDAYEYFAGLDAKERPIWTHDQQQMRAVFTDRNRSQRGCGGTCNMTSLLQEAVYIRGLGRFIGTAQGPYVGQTSFYEAPAPWGPWTAISYNNIDPATGAGGWANLGVAGGESLGVHLISGWSSHEGTTLWATYSSDGKAPPDALFPPPGTLMDSFNLVKLHFKTTPVNRP